MLSRRASRAGLSQLARGEAEAAAATVRDWRSFKPFGAL